MNIPAALYDALIDWPRRLANEEPFYRRLFERHAVRAVLDVACGSGRHAAMFHSWGLDVEGADVSPDMIELCRARHGERDHLRWTVRSFTTAPSTPAARDAVICVGHSLALAPDEAAARQALRQILAALRPGGVAVIQVLNLWRLPDGPPLWQKCVRLRMDDGEHLIVKGVHRAGDRGFVNLVDVRLSESGVSPRYETTPFLGLRADQLADTAVQAGARAARCLGDFQESPYRAEQSTDLILVVER